MSPALQTCENLALKLPEAERALLAEHLLASLAADHATEQEIADLWLAEAKRRYAAYRAGTMDAIPAEEALRELRAAMA